ncbi:MAG: hypothetical protein ABIP39_16570 [Polyangiaceae bacterium]
MASVFCSGLACGGAPPPEPTVLPAVAAKPVTIAAAPADVSAVPEPKTMLMFANIAKPAQALRVVGGWTNMPMPAADEASELLTGATIGRAIDLEKPVSVAVASDPSGRSVKPIYAISVAVVSLEEAKKALSERFKMTASSGGIIKLDELKHDKRDRGDEDDDDDGDNRKCELIPAYGAAATRLICGGTDSALLLLGPYLARTATRATFPSDLHVDLRLEPVKPMVTQGRAMLPMLVRSILGSQAGSSPMTDILNAVVGDAIDLALDLDKVSFDATLSDPSATGIISASFSGSQSTMARIATSHPERADAPPATFWHLPSDADAAFFSRGMDAKEMEHPRDLIIEAIGRGLDKEGVAAADKRAVGDALKDWLALTSAPAVYAKGVDWAAVQKSTADAKSAKTAGKEDAERAALEQYAGWSIVGIDEPMAKVGSVAKEWVTAWNRPGMAKFVKEKTKEGSPATFKIQPLSKGITLPKDTLHLVLTVTHEIGVDPSEPPVIAKKGAPAPKPKLAKPMKLHVLVVPDAGRTWIAMGADEALAASKVKLALSTTTDATTLARRDGLDDLRSAKVNSGGFVSVRGIIASSALGYAFEKQNGSFRDPFRSLVASPQQGTTPVPFSFVAQSPSPGGAGSVLVSAKIPRAAIQDIVHLAMH